MFDFTPVGIGLAIAGVVFLSLAWRLLPRGLKGASTMDAAFTLEGYTTEASVPEKSPAVGKTIARTRSHGRRRRGVHAGARTLAPACARDSTTPIKAGDILLIEGEPAALDRLVDKAELKLAREESEKVDSTRRATRPA